MTSLELAATLLEIESLFANARAQALKRNEELFLRRIYEANALVTAFTTTIVRNGGAEMAEVFLAVPSEPPPAADAVDPSAANPGNADTARESLIP